MLGSGWTLPAKFSKAELGRTLQGWAAAPDKAQVELQPSRLSAAAAAVGAAVAQHMLGGSSGASQGWGAQRAKHGLVAVAASSTAAGSGSSAEVQHPDPDHK